MRSFIFVSLCLSTPFASAFNLKLPDVKACKPVYDACMKAKGKDAANCVDTIKKGGSVKDVKIDPNDLKNCAMSAKK